MYITLYVKIGSIAYQNIYVSYLISKTFNTVIDSIKVKVSFQFHESLTNFFLRLLQKAATLRIYLDLDN